MKALEFVLLIFFIFSSHLNAFASTLFMESEALDFESAIDSKLAAAKLLSKLPAFEINLLDLPTTENEYFSYRRERNQKIKKLDFDFAVVTGKTLKEMMLLSPQIIPIGEVAFGNKPACTVNLTFLRHQGKSVTASSGTRVAGFRVHQNKLIQISSNPPVSLFFDSKDEVFRAVNKWQLFAVLSQEKADGTLFHPYKDEMKKHKIELDKTLNGREPCGIIVRKPGTDRGDSQVINGINDSGIKRRILPVTSTRQAEIMSLLRE